MKRETKELKPWQGFVTFAVVLLFTQFIAFPIQRAIGLWGVFITEIGLLAIALLANLVFGGNLKRDFSFNKFTTRQLFGGTFIWLGGLFAGFAVNYIIMWLFPGMAERSAGMASMFTSENIFVGILIVAVSPAICEEMVHRGFIMGSFAGIKNKALVVIMTGIIFGIFHLDPYRFIQTALLGAAFAYVLVETKSILLTMIFHFINNFYSIMVQFFSVKSGMLNEETVQMAQSMINGTMVLAFCLIFGALSLGALYGGYMLITKREKKPHQIRSMVIVIVTAVVLMMSGFVVNVVNVLNSFISDKTITNVSGEFDNNGRINDTVVIEEDGTYVFFADWKVDRDGAIVAMVLRDEDGKVYFDATGWECSIESMPIELKSGKYIVEDYKIPTREEWDKYCEYVDADYETDYEFTNPENYSVKLSYKIVKK